MNAKRAVIFVCCALLLAGCGSEADAPKAERGEANKTARAPTPGGRLVEATLGEPSNLLPPLASDAASHAIADLVYVAPMKYDKNIELQPWAAKSCEVLEDGRLLRFRLREDIRWFDGTPVTAEDVAFTYRFMIDPKTPTPYAEDYKAVSSFTVTGPYAFEVRYDKPFARALVTWANAILPRHALEGQDPLKTRLSREPLGAGPYKLKEWVPGSSLTLKANDDYFEGRPYIDEVVVRVIPDQSTQFLELKAGNLDLMELTPQQYLFQTTGKDWDEGFAKYKYLSFGYTYLAYNMQSPFFRDVRVRRALAQAIDKDEIVKGVLHGLGVPAVGPYKPGTWPYNQKIRQYEFDPAKAKALLAQAGFSDHDGDGILDKDGRPFAFTILTNQGNSQRVKTATIVQSRLAALGIRVEIRTVEWAAFLKEFVDKGRFDALILGWSIPQDPDIFDIWHSSKAVPGGLNFIGYKNPRLDELLERGRRTLDQAKRKVFYDQVQEILHEDQPYCFLYVPMALPIVQAAVQGIEPAPAGISHNFPKWWIDTRLRPRAAERTPQ